MKRSTNVLLFYSNIECRLSPFKPSSSLNITQNTSDFKPTNRNEFVSKLFIIPDMPISTSYEYSSPKHQNCDYLLQTSLYQDAKGTLVGYKSGIRSVIVFTKDNIYRLKGCGNNYEGFSYRQVNGSDKKEIRGCMFSLTSFNEIKMSYLVNSIGLPQINMPYGFYCYGDDKGVSRYCNVYETRGDKRLNDHLVLGLERIIKLFCNVKDYNEMVGIFKKERASVATWFVEVSGGDVNQYVNMLEYLDMFDIDIKVPDLSEEMLVIWKECLMKLQNCNIKLLFVYMFWKLGYEAGMILSKLHKNEISWGTYSDLLGDHCNAHPNNLALISKDFQKMDNLYDNKTSVLAPLDFDMAFEKKYYNGKIEFDEILKNEKKYMIIALSGFDINSGSKKSIEMKNESLELLKWGLRDTMILALNLAYEGKKDKHKHNFTMDQVYSFLSLCLILTEKNLA